MDDSSHAAQAIRSCFIWKEYVNIGRDSIRIRHLVTWCETDPDKEII